MNLYSTVFININLNEHFFFGGGGEGGISRSQVILSVLYIFWFEGGTSHKNSLIHPNGFLRRVLKS